MSGGTVAQPAKFDFGTVFDGLVEDPEAYERNKEPTWTADELEREKAVAYANGNEAGRTEALAGIEQRAAQALEQVIAGVGQITNRLGTFEAGLSSEAKSLSVAVGQAIASELLAQSHASEIEAIVSEALGFLTQQPHVVVRIHEDLLEHFTSRLEALADSRGFMGKLIILGEPDLEQADCRIEWAEGGITRDTNALAARLDEIVQRHLAPHDQDDPQADLFTYISADAPKAPGTTEETSE